MFWIWYLRIMGLIYIIGVAVGVFRPRDFELGYVELVGESYMVGNLFSPESVEAFRQMGIGPDATSIQGTGELAVFFAKIWNFVIRSIPGVVLIALGEGLAALFYIERRLKQRSRQPVPPPNVPSYAARPKSSVPEDWR